MPVPPVVLSMILCDNVHRDASTGKLYILGTFSTLAAPAFPVKFPIFFVCVSLTDAEGEVGVRLEIVDATRMDAKPIAQGESTATFLDRFAVLESAFPFSGVEFPYPGEYRAQLLVGGTLLMERRIIVMDSSKPTDDE